MKVLAFNGSPRKKGNTATLLQHALEGARSKGAETELVHLYDLQFKGCVSCFSCKRIGGRSYGACAMKDDLTPFVDQIREADALIIGSPVYCSDVTGETRSMLERLLFPYIAYEKGYPSLFPRKIQTAFIYTMNVKEEDVSLRGYESFISANRSYLERAFGHSEQLLSTDTYQFDDYDKYVSSSWDKEAKAKRRAEHFPQECRQAYELGVRFGSPASEEALAE